MLTPLSSAIRISLTATNQRYFCLRVSCDGTKHSQAAPQLRR